MNLENYVDAPEDGKVVAWPTERTDPDIEGGDPEIEFTVKAQVLRETEEGREARLKREEEKRVREEERKREEEEARLREEEEARSGADGDAEPGQEEGNKLGGEEATPAEEELDETTVEPPAESTASKESDKDEL